MKLPEDPRADALCRSGYRLPELIPQDRAARLVRGFFETEHLLVPTAVYREIAVTPLLPLLATLDWVRVHAVEQGGLSKLAGDREYSELGAGEQEAIALASTLTDSVLLISDRRAGRYARGLGVNAVDIPAFLLAYRRSGAPAEAIRELVDALEEKDHYGFSETVLEQILR